MLELSVDSLMTLTESLFLNFMFLIFQDYLGNHIKDL